MEQNQSGGANKMKSQNRRAAIKMSTEKRTYTYESVAVLTLSMTYPKVRLKGAPEAESRINCRIQTEVADFLCNATNVLYRQAVASYRYSQENGFPFNAYDAVMLYEVTYNENCYLSLYYDEYMYTGGAHGNTLRASDTWNLFDGCALLLAAFFAPDQDYRGTLIDHGQIAADAGEEHLPVTVATMLKLLDNPSRS